MDIESVPLMLWSAGIDPSMFLDPISYEDLALPAAQTAVTFANLATNAVVAICSVDGNDMRYRVDGIPPNNTTGHFVPNQSTVTLMGRNVLQSAQFCAASGVAATLRVSYYILKPPTIDEILKNYPGFFS